MLRIYPVVLRTIEGLRRTLGILDHKDRDLSRQLRRCSASCALNLGEGQYSRGKNRAAKYHIALGSAREMLSCLEVAEAFGYIPPVSSEMRENFDRIIGSLVRLVERSG
ncbi:MAG: four helix bundle protein [Polyangiaceae bacterium]|nr:four helix bundle protein [Polyangiaceae bacterium]